MVNACKQPSHCAASANTWITDPLRINIRPGRYQVDSPAEIDDQLYLLFPILFGEGQNAASTSRIRCGLERCYCFCVNL